MGTIESTKPAVITLKSDLTFDRPLTFDEVIRLETLNRKAFAKQVIQWAPGLVGFPWTVKEVSFGCDLFADYFQGPFWWGYYGNFTLVKWLDYVLRRVFISTGITVSGRIDEERSSPSCFVVTEIVNNVTRLSMSGMEFSEETRGR